MPCVARASDSRPRAPGSSTRPSPAAGGARPPGGAGGEPARGGGAPAGPGPGGRRGGGGAARATTGELVIFASGAASDLAAVADVLAPMGAVRTVGAEIGQGQAIKVVNQHLCSVHLVAAAEALALGASLGLEQADVLDLVAGGAAGSWMLSDRGPRMLQDTDVPVLSTIGIFVKDSGLVADAAASAHAEVPVLAAARERLLQAADAGLERRDDSRVIETYAR